ncbi:hypothetical protein ACHAWO_002680 [Cyclotella atomus]|uniref:SPX domain-containing protein n=1 Tax=Cyclotella atomus TaxID=382360 RepID=A0ABD3N9T4_9STRA
MVEFGLKLEDNKVEQWSDKYIDYEKLKAILKKAKVASNNVQDLKKKLPRDVVESCSMEYDARKVREEERRLLDQQLKLQHDENNSGIHSALTSRASSPLTTLGEDAPLLLERKSSFGSAQSDAASAGAAMKRQNSWTSFSNTVFKVTSYLGLADDKKILYKALEEAGDKMKLFGIVYNEEVQKVKDFYQDKLHELSEHIEAILESVDTSHIREKPKKKRKSSIIDDLVLKFENVMHHRKVSSDRIPSIRLSISRDSSDVEDNYTDSESPVTKIRSTSSSDKLDLERESDSIKRALTDVYRNAKMLHNYAIMNYTGFVKIAKKFDKTLPAHKGVFKNIICEDGMQAEVLAAKIERMYSKWFSDGNIREAQAQLLSKRGDGLMMDWTQLRLGYRLGMCSILGFWVAWDCIWGQFAKDEISIGGRSAFPVFRACFGLVSWHWFWGISVYIWSRYRINYIYLFEFDPRNIDTPMDIFNDAVDETLVFLLLMLIYYKAGAGDFPQIVPPGAYPLFLIIYAVKCLIFPWKMRKPLWIAIRQVILAPFVSPTFFLIFVGDVFTSMVKVFQDILWSAMFVVSGDWMLSEHSSHHGIKTQTHTHVWAQSFWYKNVAIPLICLFPLWLRFNQCLRRYLDTGKRVPNLPNAFKYAMSQTVTLFGTFHPLYLMSARNHDITEEGTDIILKHRKNLFQAFWMCLFIASSLYSFIWDVYMDWGLGRKEFGFLGPRLMFPSKSYYYMVICADLILRFMWVLTLVPPDSGAKFELPAYLTAVTMTVELFRRTIWSFFRLEHEQRQNTLGFRRVHVVPLHFSTGHKHKYNERHWVGWKVLVEIMVVTLIVVAVSAFSVISAQRATTHYQLELSHDSHDDLL